MRIVLWLASALVALLEVQGAAPGGRHFDLDKFDDGTVFSILFKHVGEETEPEEVGVDFYDAASSKVDADDDHVHLKLRRVWEYYGKGNGGHGLYVISNTHENGRWLDQPPPDQMDQSIDYSPLSNGWWKVDVIRIDKYHMNVFFNGYWSGIRKFEMSLDRIKSVFINSHVDPDSVIFWNKVPNGNIDPLSLAETQKYMSDTPPEYRKLFRVESFPDGKSIEIVAIMRSSGKLLVDGKPPKRPEPTLMFMPVDESVSYLMKIIQFWGGSGLDDANYWEPSHNTNEMHVAIYEHHGALPMKNQYRKDKDTTLCTDYHTRPNGDLLHLKITRTGNVIKTTIDDKHISCQVEIPADRVLQLDKPFNIMNTGGAFIVHLVKPEQPVVQQPAAASGMVWDTRAKAASLTSLLLLPALATLCLMIVGRE